MLHLRLGALLFLFVTMQTCRINESRMNISTEPEMHQIVKKTWGSIKECAECLVVHSLHILKRGRGKRRMAIRFFFGTMSCKLKAAYVAQEFSSRFCRHR